MFITGASRGFGKAVALAFARLVDADLHLHLSCCSNIADYETVKAELEVIRSSIKAKTYYYLTKGDLANLTTLPEFVDAFFGAKLEGEGSEKLVQKVTFINNAGSLGPLHIVGSTPENLEEMSQAINLNVTGAMYLSAQFTTRFRQGAFGSSCVKAELVNVSSLAAIQPFNSWGIYCAGKAAREMYHVTLAQEQNKINQGSLEGEKKEINGNASSPASTTNEVSSSINSNTSTLSATSAVMSVLNYAPGPMDTDMQLKIRNAPCMDTGIRSAFRDMQEKGTLVNPQDSANKLVNLLKMGLYKSGEHVDFYDEIEAL